MININDFKKHKDWIKVWSGKWSLHFASHQGFWWTQNKNIDGKPFFKKAIYFYKNGITECWVSAADKDSLGKRLKELTNKNPAYISKIANGLMAEGKKVREFPLKNPAKNFGLETYQKFWQIYSNYFVYHVSVKYVIDYLSPKQIKKYLPGLEKARLYAEPVTREAENYWESAAGYLCAETTYSRGMLLSTTPAELELFLQGKNLPKPKLLEARYKNSAILLNAHGLKIFTASRTLLVKKIIPLEKSSSTITGQIAYPGLVKGQARIIFDPLKEEKKFKNSDILVTGMTRPEFLPLMHKAVAFVTDAGGILSHAAITARELKKPCVIGTKFATKVFKDGDIIEVDANQGIVKKVN